jgi:hypothetical protein
VWYDVDTVERHSPAVEARVLAGMTPLKSVKFDTLPFFGIEGGVASRKGAITDRSPGTLSKRAKTWLPRC